MTVVDALGCTSIRAVSQYWDDRIVDTILQAAY